MATVTHTLYSHYDPKDRRKLERESGQPETEIDPEEQWRKEAAQIYPNRMLAPPRFVPAKSSYDPWGTNDQTSSSKVKPNYVPRTELPDSMFKSLPRSKAGSAPHPIKPTPAPSPIPEPRKPNEKATKNNWFIMKAMQSDSGSTSVPATPAPTLADILARDPPPLSSAARHKPPMWMHIGPANKGFAMLQRSGWNEGETLGPYAARRKAAEPIPLSDVWPMEDAQVKTSSQPVASSSSKRIIEVKLEDDEISELKQVDVIDLTLSSDSDDSDDSEDEVEESSSSATPMDQLDDESEADHTGISGHGGQALLTPIATVLKADRMGIGLKPRTTAGPAGAYRIPQKRVTHNSAALAAHIRAGMELRQQKREGDRGRRAFERQRKKEASERKALLAYMNS